MEWNMEENLSMKWNMEENFSMEWKIFGMEWKWNERKLLVWNMKNRLPFHTMPCRWIKKQQNFAETHQLSHTLGC